MPELIVHRKNATPPMVCMYCGAPATSTTEWHEANHAPGKAAGGGGTDLVATPTGDDPISGLIAVVMLPLVLWELLKGIAAGIGVAVGYLTRPAPVRPPAPEPKPKEQPTTRIVVTTCDRHRRFRARFVWAGAAGAVVLAALWVWAVLETRRVMGTEDVGLAVTLVFGAIFASVVLPLALSVWYAFGGPVIADRVTADAVVLDRVRSAYFDATGQKPYDAAA